MSREPNVAELAPELLATLVHDTDAGLSRKRFLYRALYAAITDGRLPAGTVLPPSRQLSAQLGIARNVVVAVYTQLGDEALVEAAGRRGTCVSATRFAGTPFKRVARAATARAWDRSVQLSNRSGVSAATSPTLDQARGRTPRADEAAGDFAPGEPDPTLFPFKWWKRALGRAATLSSDELGYRPRAAVEVREAIVRWLATRRSLVVDPARVVVTNGTRQSLCLAALLGTSTGDAALVESPGYRGAMEAFAAFGLRVRAAAVDAGGIVLPGGPAPRIVYVTPCFQSPSGVPLAASRRDALLELSERSGTLVFEDDYDSEFRDASEPRPALAAEADTRAATVLHAGTFSKLLFPAARVGWLVVPDMWVERAEGCLRTLGGGHGQVMQRAVASLLDDGSVARHLRRARGVYLHRREVLDASVRRCMHLRGAEPGGGALGAIVEVVPGARLTSLERALADDGFGARPLERFAVSDALPRTCRALVLGLGNVDALAIPARVAALDRIVGAVSR